MISLLQSYFRAVSLPCGFRPVNTNKIVSQTCLCLEVDDDYVSISSALSVPVSRQCGGCFFFF